MSGVIRVSGSMQRDALKQDRQIYARKLARAGPSPDTLDAHFVRAYFVRHGESMPRWHSQKFTVFAEPRAALNELSRDRIRGNLALDLPDCNPRLTISIKIP